MSYSELNEQQRKFVECYIETGHIMNSAKSAGYSESSAHVQGSRMLKNDKIYRAIRERQDELKAELNQRFMQDAIKAREVLLDIMCNPDANPQTRYQCAKDFLDRAGFKYTDKQEIEGKGDVKVYFNIPRPSNE